MSQPNSPNREDAIVRSMQVLNLDAAELPERPALGSLGNSFKVVSNFFTMDLKITDAHVLGRYTLTVTPEVHGKKLARVISLFFQVIPGGLQGGMAVSDFAGILLTNHPDGSKVRRDTKTFDVVYYGEGFAGPSPNAETFKVTRTFDRILPIGLFMNHLRAGKVDSKYACRTEIVQALNIWTNHFFKAASGRIVTVGGHKKFPKVNGEVMVLDGGIKAARGFFSSVRLASKSLQLNVNLAHATFYQTANLAVFITELKKMLKARYQPHGWDDLERYIRKVRVQLIHLERIIQGRQQPVIKTIWGFAGRNDGDGSQVSGYGMPEQVQFNLQTERGVQRVTVADYFKRAHGRTIVRHDLPVINVGTKDNPVYVPPELCTIDEGQLYRHQLLPDQTRAMIDFAARRPHVNRPSVEKTIGNFWPQVPGQVFKYLATIGTTFGNKLQQADARILPAPQVGYLKDKTPDKGAASGSWNLRNVKFRKAGVLKSPALIFIGRTGSVDERTSRETVSGLESGLKEAGITIPHERIKLLPTVQNAEEVQRQISAYKDQVDFLFIILPHEDSEMYTKIKISADQQYGVPTLCAVRSKVTKRNATYFANLALKVNLKLGGDNHLVRRSHLQFIGEGKTMIVGMDVTHPSAASRAPSVAAMVASVDGKLGQWPGILRAQQSRQEMIADLELMLKSRLHLWQERNNGSLPQNIIVYRDGVSEGQYNQVLTYELPQLRKACQDQYRNRPLPKMTVVVVGKRHNTRFYPDGQYAPDAKVKGPHFDMSGNGNFKPGLLVEQGVTDEGLWDFYLQSHAAITGTAKPAHYIVLLDEVFAAADDYENYNIADKLHQMTHGLCFMFGRATKSVSYCTPAYYADILCERGRRYLSRVFDVEPPRTTGPKKVAELTPQEVARFNQGLQVHPRLKNTMFYL